MADLLGRRAEREAVEMLLSRARAGHSGTLVVRGEAGIGKTALLELGRDAAASSGFRVESSTGVEAETQFAFAGLHQLCAPLLDRAEALPDPQRSALGVAFGRRDGVAPDRFLVGLATLNLLAEVAEEGPLVCLVDDAQWLDQASAQVLAFVARRVAAERMALVFALRDQADGESLAFAGLPELRLGGLGESDARALLTGAVHAPLDDGVRDRVVAEARGNPLALLELPLSAQPAQLAGGFELPDVASIPRRIEDSFQRRSVSLPPETQVLLLVAASEPTGDTALLRRAAEHLGIARDAAAPAEAAGLLEIDTRVRFRHPLVRSAVYQAATPPDRRRVHGALAAATDPETDPDRRAWHRAQAVLGTDEEVAAELERSAGRARARGGLAAAAAFLEQAAKLTPEPAARAGRALEAARAKYEAGSPVAALELLAVAEAGQLGTLQRGRVQLLGAQIGYHFTRGRDAPRLLLDAASMLVPLDLALARETYLEAFDAALIVSGLDHGCGVREVAAAVKAAPTPIGPPRPADLLLDGMATTFTQGYAAGAAELSRALELFCDRGQYLVEGERHNWLSLASRIAIALFDDEGVHVLADRNVLLARETGALAVLPFALAYLSSVWVITGDFSRASELADEQITISNATGAAPMHSSHLLLAAWRGRESETTDLLATIIDEATARGEGTEVSLAHYSRAVLHNALGDYPVALVAAARACESDEFTISNVSLFELVEAASRAGEPEHAIEAMEELSSRARVSDTPWALGLAARSRALTSTGSAAENLYLEAIEHLRTCRIATHLARTHLVYGEWLRREGRRQDAREQLRTAHDLLSNMGAEAFAARAARELSATGEHPRKRTAQPIDELTSHELHIARLVATGATSREVGAQLFLSPRTIETHLRNIFRKLGITSRRQLRELPLP